MESNPTEADTGSAKLQGLKRVLTTSNRYSVNGIPAIFRVPEYSECGSQNLLCACVSLRRTRNIKAR